MTYQASSGREAQLILRAIRGATDFKGRSRRTELLCYQIMVALIGVVVGFVGMAVLPHEILVWVISLLQIVATIPLFALLTRRLHDQNRSGWWGLTLPAAICLNLLENYRFSAGHGEMSNLPAPWIMIRIVLIILLLLFTFWPGTVGLNRFGEDPRLA